MPGGASIIDNVNALMQSFDTVVLSQDWHPASHKSFARAHPGKAPYDTVDMAYGTQVLWPEHCVIGSSGAEFHPALQTDLAHLIVRKGFRPEIDSYSAFFENDQSTATGLDGYLKSRNINEVTVVGLAYDFCVQYSAIDAAKLGYKVTVLPDLCKAIDLGGSENAATKHMKSANISLK